MNRRRFLNVSGAASLAPFLPSPVLSGVRRHPTGYIRTNWSKDPYAFGSYSFFQKGSGRRDVRALAAPLDDKLFFAGEATHPQRNSTVHAAYESGVLAAQRIAMGQAHRIAIIGAGASGLAAAKHLTESGHEVTLFEARNRIGGRVWTDMHLGHPLDLGASWIHGMDGNPLTELAKARGATIVPTDDSYIVRGKNGRVVPDGHIPDWLTDIIEFDHTFATERSEMSKTAFLTGWDYDGADIMLPEGYLQLFEPMAKGLEIRLNTPIQKINSTAELVELTDDRGTVHRHDAVLVTVPLGVLQSGALRFTPALPKRKAQAIERLGMGVLDKVFLKFDEVFWDAGITWIAIFETGLPRGQFHQFLNLAPVLKAPILLAFNAATPARALAELPDTEVLRRAMIALESAYPS